MFFDVPLRSLLEQAAALPGMLQEHYAALFAEIERRDATYQSLCDPSWDWLASEIDRIHDISYPKSKPGLFGLPVGVKDTLVVSGLPTKAGTPADVGQILGLPQSPAVSALRDAGAVIVAKQATNQFCSSAGPASTQAIRGKDYFAGGSTVGGAVAVAAGFTRLALGSDAAGSIRHPAALAGVAGLRPRKGAISDEGQVGGALSGQSTGLLARSADDIAQILQACPSLHDGPHDERILDRELPTIGIPDISWPDIAPAAEDALRASADRLSRMGHKVVPTSLWQTQEAHDDFFLVMSFENWMFHKALMAEHSEIYEPAVYKVMRAGETIEPHDVAAARLRLVDHRERFLDLALAQGVDMLLTPSIPWPDIKKDAGSPRELSMIGARFTAVSNIYDVDSLSVPVVREPKGWPRSVMLHGLTIPLSSLLKCAQGLELPLTSANSR
jgi:Asp-tRNA(Asn)/Glu-tRNA(Gln) amidotransferase A subunit family amidase